MTSASFTEQLANLPTVDVMYFVIAATLIRLSLIHLRIVAGRPWAEFIESAVIAVVLVFLLIRPFVVKAYFIPSPSMVPTLLGKNGSGDRILVNNLAYRLGSPHHDNVVVFIPPPQATEGSTDEEPPGVPIVFIKRLIAEPGDVIQVKAGRIMVNSQEFSHYYLRRKLIESNYFGNDSMEPDTQADHHIKFTKNAVLVDQQPIPNTKIAEMLTSMPDAKVRIEPGETILNGHVLDEPFIAEDPDYDMQLYKGQPLKFDPQAGDSNYRYDGVAISKEEYDLDHASAPEALPPHTYFMMGDNRNDSKDSTEWGPLDVQHVVGKAQFIFWPLTRIRAIH